MGKDSNDLKHAMFTAGDAVIGAALLVVVGVVAGNWLDAKLHTSPWCVVCLSLLGAGLGLWRMVRKAMLMSGGTSTSSDPLEQPLSDSAAAVKAKPIDSSGSSPDASQPAAGHKDHQSTAKKTPASQPEPAPRSAFDFLDQGDSK